MTDEQIHEALMSLAKFRKNLRALMDPQVLEHLAKFLESTGEEDHGMLERYEWFSENSENGPDCRYALMAKKFFLRDQATDVAETISWLYHNFANTYEK
jgi:hypothetical protein